MQNGILKTALGELLATLAAFLVTFWVFLSLPASFLFVVFVVCDVSFCFGMRWTQFIRILEISRERFGGSDAATCTSDPHSDNGKTLICFCHIPKSL